MGDIPVDALKMRVWLRIIEVQLWSTLLRQDEPATGSELVCAARVPRCTHAGLEHAEKLLLAAAAACTPAPPPCSRQAKPEAASALKKNWAAGVAVTADGPAQIIATGPDTSTWTCGGIEPGSNWFRVVKQGLKSLYKSLPALI